jgi:phosphoribosylanthranilate isomerase
MTWIKICGITNLEDALLAVDAGADALGFVFYEKSSRRVNVEMAREIVAELPERVEKVGVFVEQTPGEIREVVTRANLTVAQLNDVSVVESLLPGQNAAEHTKSAKLIVALQERQFAEQFSLDVAKDAKGKIFAILLDSGSPSSPGGTGKTFNWNARSGVVAAISSVSPVIVAGGLNPDNVGEAIRTLHPWGIDVASGTEARPGKKDPEKVRAFVEAVRRADRAA